MQLQIAGTLPPLADCYEKFWRRSNRQGVTPPMLGLCGQRQTLQGASDAERAMPNAWRHEHWPPHTRWAGAQPESQLETRPIFRGCNCRSPERYRRLPTATKNFGGVLIGKA
jgi:hypothetical protein